ncbi:hypothetical protein PRZ48_013883 [Zasmidium cellare]|uniref:Malate dehydrogenase n=1 Tax=Zasmidium cellare TaxID=395010 RepID=A0ABR0DZD2_ZASCE|nr:hypothetical protein PRZ48_013883 [Zasmidium cellare]
MANSTEEQKKFHVSATDAESFVKAVLRGNVMPDDNAAVVAKCLVAADLRGVDTHGVNRIPSYMARIREGLLDGKASPDIHQVDGKNGFGFVAASRAMIAACEMAKVYGIGMVSVKHSNDFGMGAWIAQQAIEEAGMMSLVFTNSSPAMPAWGSKEKLIGISPLACGAPGKDRPFILDMAPSVAARGKIYKALRREEKLPEGCMTVTIAIL